MSCILPPDSDILFMTITPRVGGSAGQVTRHALFASVLTAFLFSIHIYMMCVGYTRIVLYTIRCVCMCGDSNPVYVTHRPHEEEPKGRSWSHLLAEHQSGASAITQTSFPLFFSSRRALLNFALHS